MKIITIEEHYADSRIIESNAKYGYPSGMAELSGKVRAAYDGMRFTGDKLTDVDTVRFDFMKEQQVDMQVLSYTTPVSDMVPYTTLFRSLMKLCVFAGRLMIFLRRSFKSIPNVLRHLRLCQWLHPMRRHRNLNAV